MAVRSVWRAPGTRSAWISAIACSLIQSARRRHASSSGVLVSRTALMTSLAARGGQSGSSAVRSWCMAPVSSSTAMVAPAGTSPARTFPKAVTPSARSR